MTKIWTLTLAMALVIFLPLQAKVEPDRSLGEKQFQLTMGVWVDLEYNAKEMSEQIIKVQYLSKDYFHLMEKYPAILPYLAMGKRLILVLPEEVVSITPDL